MTCSTIVLAGMLLWFVPSSLHAADITPTAQAGPGFEALLDEAGTLWKRTTDDFMMREAPTFGFTWVSKEQRNAARSAAPALRFLGIPVAEVLMNFREDHPSELVILFYNRGDTGEITREQFDAIVAKVSGAVTTWARKRSRPGPSGVATGEAKKEALVWSGPVHEARLEWSYTSGSAQRGIGFRAEYVRLQCQSATVGAGYADSQAAKRQNTASVSVGELREHITRTAEGDVYIKDVPMVDQGKKGYCVVAATERVMRYYGRDIDQHELAQLALTDTGGGTNPEAMMNALRRAGLKLGCKIRILESLDYNAFMRAVKDYNRVAEAQGKAPVTVPAGGEIDIGAVFAAMNVDIMRTARLKQATALKKFQTNIATHIDKGLPLEWTVVLGKIPEEGLDQAAGGHMRLIIGYNEKTAEILYSDSWGPGHELKRMGREDAWTITQGLYLIEPQRYSM